MRSARHKNTQTPSTDPRPGSSLRNERTSALEHEKASSPSPQPSSVRRQYGRDRRKRKVFSTASGRINHQASVDAHGPEAQCPGRYHYLQDKIRPLRSEPAVAPQTVSQLLEVKLSKSGHGAKKIFVQQPGIGCSSTTCGSSFLLWEKGFLRVGRRIPQRHDESLHRRRTGHTDGVHRLSSEHASWTDSIPKGDEISCGQELTHKIWLSS